MNLLEELTRLKCATSSNDHIVKGAQLLSCQHYICNTCLPVCETVECKICGEITMLVNVKNEQNSIFIKELMNVNMDVLFTELERETIKGISRLNSKKNFFFLPNCD